MLARGRRRRSRRHPTHAALYAPVPQVRHLGPLVDVYSLWLSTRNAFLGWAIVICHPPLHLAVPFQAFGLWRIVRAGFCRSPVLRHPVVVARTGECAYGAVLCGRAAGALCEATADGQQTASLRACLCT